MPSHTHTTLINLGPATVYTVARLTMSPDMYSALETCGILGTMYIGRVGQTDCGDTTWGWVIEHVSDQLQYNKFNMHLVMSKEDPKVHFFLALNQDTLSFLDNYITMQGADKMAHLETIQDRLCC